MMMTDRPSFLRRYWYSLTGARRRPAKPMLRRCSACGDEATLADIYLPAQTPRRGVDGSIELRWLCKNRERCERRQQQGEGDDDD